LINSDKMNEPVTVKEEVIMATYKCEKCGMADTLSTKTTYYLPTSSVLLN
jgi:hypothetical protein